MQLGKPCPFPSMELALGLWGGGLVAFDSPFMFLRSSKGVGERKGEVWQPGSGPVGLNTRAPPLGNCVGISVGRGKTRVATHSWAHCNNSLKISHPSRPLLPSCRGVSFHGTTIGLAPLMAMCSVYQSGGVNMVSQCIGGTRRQRFPCQFSYTLERYTC